MKQLLVIATLFLSQTTYAYEGPAPLRDVKIDSMVSMTSNDIYKYSYVVANPSLNNGDISGMDIFLPQDKERDAALSSEGLHACPLDLGSTIEMVNKKYLVPPAGSDAPKEWSCGYGTLFGHTSASYRWGSSDETMIKPGKSQSGFAIYSRGLPAIREISVRADIDQTKLPPDYFENLEKTHALQQKVNWNGKTIGPKAPPKVFEGESYIRNIIVSNGEAEKLGWVKNSGFARSVEAKLDAAGKKIASGDKKTAQNILSALQNEIEAQKGKQLSPEAYALLYYNVDYVLKQLVSLSDKKSK